jgi:hypothetical protein
MIRRIRRKSETVRLTNERDFPHLVELALPQGRRPPPHSDLKVSAAAVDDESCQDNKKHNCGGDRPPVIFASPWVGPPAVVATRTASIFKVRVYHFRAPR